MKVAALISTLSHRYFRIPYTLHYHEFHAPKRPVATLVFIHGIGNTLHSWDDVAKQLPPNVRAIGIDLLGFGKSPKPLWAVYDAKTQARSVAMTLLKIGSLQRPIIVGHSLGALVAVAVAKRHPLIPKQLVLCSPPFYAPVASEPSLLRSRDDLLRDLYRTAKKHPAQLESMIALAAKVGLANKSYDINGDAKETYFAALEASIINQTSLQDIAKLNLPVTIFYGVLDPVVVGSHIVKLKNEHANITAKRLMAGHEILGGYAVSLVKYLAESVQLKSGY